MAFLVDPDELQRAMDEIAARQRANMGSGGASPPATPPDIAAGQHSVSQQTSTPSSAATRLPAPAANGYSKFNPYAGINYNFIAGHEGPREDPYLPPGNSGVTIATGVDLSEHTAQELRDWGVSEDTIAKLAPFLKSSDGKIPGPKGDAAQTALNKFNLENPTSADGLPRYEIPMSDSQAMDTGALKSITGYVQHYYDAANPARHLRNCRTRSVPRSWTSPTRTAPILRPARPDSGGLSRQTTGWGLPTKCTIGLTPKRPIRTRPEANASWTMKGFCEPVFTLPPSDGDAARSVWYGTTGVGGAACAFCIWDWHWRVSCLWRNP